MKVNQFSYKAPDEETLRQMEEYYYDNHSIRDVAKKFNTTEMKIRVLRNKGLVHMERTPEQKRRLNSVKHVGIKHSEKTKKKLSLIRKQWIAENPDKSPYIVSHKSRGETYPEKYFREWLEKENIPFQQEYKFKLYAFDFLVNERIDLEIDGDQHKNDKRIIEHDIKRDNKSKDAGFIVYRIIWSDYQKLNQEERETFLYDLKNFLMDNSNPIPQFVIKKKQSRIRIKKHQPKKIVNKQEDPRKKKALEMLNCGKFYCEVAREFKVSDNAIRKWVKSLGLNPRHYGRDGKKNKERVCSSAA